MMRISGLYGTGRGEVSDGAVVVYDILRRTVVIHTLHFNNSLLSSTNLFAKSFSVQKYSFPITVTTKSCDAKRMVPEPDFRVISKTL